MHLQLIYFFILTIKLFNSYFVPFKIFKNHTKLHLIKTCFHDEEENNHRKKTNTIHTHTHFKEQQIVYTLIWYDCHKCQQLLYHMDTLKINHNYINGGYYFFDTTDTNSKFNKPLFYKDDTFISDELFDIYKEIYSIT